MFLISAHGHVETQRHVALAGASQQNSVAENIRNTLGTHWEHIGNTATASQQSSVAELLVALI